MPGTIEEIIAELQRIIDDAIQRNDRTGFFAALYLLVTLRVKEGIANGEFQNGPRMERLDVAFANRYITAYNQYLNGEQPSGSWKVAFDATKKSSVLVLQHLLLGMNAHINLDLGIATAEVMKGQHFPDIRADFIIINTVIESLTNAVLKDLSQVSPLLSLLGLHAANTSSPLIQFSISMARDGAWAFGEELSAKTGSDCNNCIEERDSTISQLGTAIISSKGFLKFTIWLIHFFEWKKPARIIKVLRSYGKKDFKKEDLSRYLG